MIVNEKKNEKSWVPIPRFPRERPVHGRRASKVRFGTGRTTLRPFLVGLTRQRTLQLSLMKPQPRRLKFGQIERRQFPPLAVRDAPLGHTELTPLCVFHARFARRGTVVALDDARLAEHNEPRLDQ